MPSPPSNQVASRHRATSSRTTSSIVLYTTGHHSQRSAIFVCRPTYRLYGVVSNTQKLNTCKYSKGYMYVRHSPLNPRIMQLQNLQDPLRLTLIVPKGPGSVSSGFKLGGAAWRGPHTNTIYRYMCLYLLISLLYPTVSPISCLYLPYPACIPYIPPHPNADIAKETGHTRGLAGARRCSSASLCSSCPLVGVISRAAIHRSHLRVSAPGQTEKAPPKKIKPKNV